MNPFRKEFEYFIQLGQTLNITRSAEILGVEQPTLSKSLLKLEDEMGGKLFIRQRTGLQFTDLGQNLFRSVSAAVENWKKQWDSNQDDLLTRSVIVRLACHRTIALDYLPQTFVFLKKEYPNLKLEVGFSSSFEVSRMVNALEVEFGIVVNFVKNAELVSRSFAKQFVGAFGTAGLAKDGRVFYNPEMIHIQRIMRKYNNHQLIPIPDYEVIAHTVARSKGDLGILPSSVAQRHSHLSLVGAKHFEVEVSLIYHRQKAMSKSSQILFEALTHSILPKKM